MHLLEEIGKVVLCKGACIRRYICLAIHRFSFLGFRILFSSACKGPPLTADRLILHANGWPKSDMLIARAGSPIGDRFEHCFRSVLFAQASLFILDRYHGAFLHQPLNCCLKWRKGWLNPASLRRELFASAVFDTGQAFWRADVLSEDPRRLALELEDLVQGKGVASLFRRGHDAAEATLAVHMSGLPSIDLRSAHRAVWGREGGPWMGIGLCDGVDFISASQCAITGQIHTRLSALIFEKYDRLARSFGMSESTRRKTSSVPDVLFERECLGVSHRVFPDGRIPLSYAAYTLGRSLHRSLGSERSIGIQIPVLPRRYGERVCDGTARSGLMHFGAEKPYCARFDLFDPWCREWVAAAAEGRNMLTRLERLVSRSRLPLGLKQRLLVSRREPGRILRLAERLGGRARLSKIVAQDGAVSTVPLLAVSYPPLDAASYDAQGSLVLTLAPFSNGFTATVSGTGTFGSRGGAAAFLDIWTEELKLLLSQASHGVRFPSNGCLSEVS